MTNKEAIKSLKKLKSFHNGSYGSAIDRAIEALEQMEAKDTPTEFETVGDLSEHILQHYF